jgi:dihydroorotase
VSAQRIWIRGGRVLDPSADRDEHGDVLIEDGQIAAVGADLQAEDAEVIDASGCWIAPGFVDLHTHLREPGQEYKEDIASGGRSAVAGGFSSIACMANTQPVNDDPAMTDFIIDRAKQDSPARVYPVAAATRGLKGEVMTEMSALIGAGAVAFSDDGKTIMDGSVMRHVLEYSRLVGAPVITHGEDRHLVANGVVNEGPVSTKLGLPGNPAVAEVVLIVRDLILADLTGAHLHVAHVSTRGAVDAIRQARERGVNATAEVTPHHLTLTDEAALGYDTNTKVAPPLRSAADVLACREGLSTNPARILRRPGGSLAVGEPADVTVLNPDTRWTYDPVKGYSKSRNSPWAGQTLEGRTIATIVGGQLVFDVERGVLTS